VTANPGDTLRIRWVLGTDTSIGRYDGLIFGVSGHHGDQPRRRLGPRAHRPGLRPRGKPETPPIRSRSIGRPRTGHPSVSLGTMVSCGGIRRLPPQASRPKNSLFGARIRAPSATPDAGDFRRIDQAMAPPAHAEQPGARGGDRWLIRRRGKRTRPAPEPPSRRCRIDARHAPQHLPPERRGVLARVQDHVGQHRADLARRALEVAHEARRAQRRNARPDAERDMRGVVAGEGWPRSVRHVPRGAGLATCTGPSSAPARRTFECERELSRRFHRSRLSATFWSKST